MLMGYGLNKTKIFRVESVSPDKQWRVLFEDDGDAGNMYLSGYKENVIGEFIDCLKIYHRICPPIEQYQEVFIVWTYDSNRAGLIVDGECWGIFDLAAKRKMSAPLKDNAILPLRKEIWDKGIIKTQGKNLHL